MSDSPMSKESEDELKSELESIPIANISSTRLEQAAEVTGSYMWLVALVCLLLAIGLVWWSLPERGIAIEISFPEGHGLETEDAVRFRGIDVGVVEEVKLNRELSGVNVRVNLKPFARPLAREGTRFWIVRPELSLAGISGLETAVGHKYIGLIPGDLDSPFQSEFDGLPASPADAHATTGIEIIIRGEKKHSVSAGSPVTCRGVEIGRILSVGLSQDARFVDVRARVFEKFGNLITSKSKFWATSGVDMDFSFSEGIKLDMESIETIARGGVSMLTTENGGQPVKPGHVFTLYSNPEEDWYRSANNVAATDVELRGVLPLEIQWQHNGFLGDSTKQQNFNGIPFRGKSGDVFAIVPADVLQLPKKGVAGSMKIAPPNFSGEPLPLEDGEAIDPEAGNLNPVRKLLVPSSFSSNWLNDAAIRTATDPETCLVVRASGDASSLTYLHFPVEKKDITPTDEGWTLNLFDGDREVWHGSPVLAASDGKLIGVLLISNRQSRVVPFVPSMLE